MRISNTYEGYVTLWQELEHTRQCFERQCRRFCVRRVMQEWLGNRATDDLIWEICMRAEWNGQEIHGFDLLPPPATHPRIHRELLRALVMVTHGIGKHSVNLRALDKAYDQVFPGSNALNVDRKRRKNNDRKVKCQ
ncbi:MAG: hypothetical protein KBT20_04070 [Bacteroidales bacterium]|nr:hypothetical protein [Candidatus Liminaster caballi]